MASSSDTWWSVLYSHQKTKKRKTFQDGKCRFNPSNGKLVLYCDQGKSLDSKFMSRGFSLESGEDIEMDRYIVQIDEQCASFDPPASIGLERATNTRPSRSDGAPAPSTSDRPKSTVLGAKRRIGLKRRRMKPLLPKSMAENAAEPAEDATPLPTPASLGVNRAVRVAPQRRRAALQSQRSVSSGFNPAVSIVSVLDQGLNRDGTGDTNNAPPIVSPASPWPSRSPHSSMLTVGSDEQDPTYCGALPANLYSPVSAVQRSQRKVASRTALLAKMRGGTGKLPDRASVVTDTPGPPPSVWHSGFPSGPSKLDDVDAPQYKSLQPAPTLKAPKRSLVPCTRPGHHVAEQSQSNRATKVIRRSALGVKPQQAKDGATLACDTGSVRSRMENEGAASAGVRAGHVRTRKTSGHKFRPPRITSNPDIAACLTWSHDHFCFPNVTVCKEVMPTASPPPLSVVVPNRFSSVQHYKNEFSAALREELNFMLLELSHRYHQAVESSKCVVGDGVTAPTCPHGTLKMLTVKKSGSNKGRMFYGCPTRACKAFQWADEWSQKQGRLVRAGPKAVPPESAPATPAAWTTGLVQFLRGQGLRVYFECKMTKTGSSGSAEADERNRKTFWRKSKSKGFDFDGFLEIVTKKRLYVQLDHREPSSSYNLGDLWLVSTTPHFFPVAPQDRLFICQSSFYGPSNGHIEMEPLGEWPRLPRKSVVYAIHGPEASGLLTMLNHLRDVKPSTFPLLPHILDPTSAMAATPLQKGQKQLLKTRSIGANWEVNLTSEELRDIVNLHVSRYKLNSDQATVLRACASWLIPSGGGDLRPINSSHSPELHRSSFGAICLVHGVFGAGKSYLLVVTILCLCEALERGDNTSIHILVAAATNTAVDRVLVGLLDHGFEQFVRVGSLQRMHKRILAFAAQKESDSKHEERELKERLKEEDSEECRAALRDLLEGRMNERRKLVRKVRVLGTTCAASTFELLNNCRFALAILDEASQMVEPLSIQTIGRFFCEKLVAVGDPLQLPPVLESFAERTATSEETGLSRPLFSRLVEAGVSPIMLRTQYRCHPHISALSNRLFYDNQLLDGVGQTDREPLVADLSTLLFIDAAAGEERQQGRRKISYCNDYECQVVLQLVQRLLLEDVQPEEVGVIALYRSQAKAIENVLGELRAATLGKEYVELQLRRLRGEPVADYVRNPPPPRQLKQVEQTRVGAKIQVSTVDAFQGSEREVVIVSCTRTSRLGFTDDPKRLNVALTRARRHLIIVGNVRNLAANPTWNAILGHVRHRGAIEDGTKYAASRGSVTTKPVVQIDLATLDEEEEELLLWESSVPPRAPLVVKRSGEPTADEMEAAADLYDNF